MVRGTCTSISRGKLSGTCSSPHKPLQLSVRTCWRISCLRKASILSLRRMFEQKFVQNARLRAPPKRYGISKLRWFGRWWLRAFWSAFSVTCSRWISQRPMRIQRSSMCFGLSYRVLDTTWYVCLIMFYFQGPVKVRFRCERCSCHVDDTSLLFSVSNKLFDT